MTCLRESIVLQCCYVCAQDYRNISYSRQMFTSYHGGVPEQGGVCTNIAQGLITAFVIRQKSNNCLMFTHTKKLYTNQKCSLNIIFACVVSEHFLLRMYISRTIYEGTCWPKQQKTLIVTLSYVQWLWNKDTSLIRTVPEMPIVYQINLWNKDTSLMRTYNKYFLGHPVVSTIERFVHVYIQCRVYLPPNMQQNMRAGK